MVRLPGNSDKTWRKNRTEEWKTEKTVDFLPDFEYFSSRENFIPGFLRLNQTADYPIDTNRSGSLKGETRKTGMNFGNIAYISIYTE